MLIGSQEIIDRIFGHFAFMGPEQPEEETAGSEDDDIYEYSLPLPAAL